LFIESIARKNILNGNKTGLASIEKLLQLPYITINTEAGNSD